MPLGVLKWRGGLRGVSSECCEPVNGVARMLKCRLWEQRGCRNLRLQWKWWLAHRLRPLKLQKEMGDPCVRQTGHFFNSIWCLHFRLYTKGGRNSTFKATHFDKIWQNFIFITWYFSDRRTDSNIYMFRLKAIHPGRPGQITGVPPPHINGELNLKTLRKLRNP